MAKLLTLRSLSKEDDIEVSIKDAGEQCSDLVFVLVSSGWCPDCLKGSPRVPPTIEDAAEVTNKSAVLLTIDVGAREEWRDPENLLRRHPLLQVQKIPTLYHFSSQGEMLDKLVEVEIYEPPETLVEFVSKAFTD